VKFIHARTDRRSTIQVGANDLTLFLPSARVLCIECKSKTGKRTQEQLAWACEMAKLGFAVHEIRTFQQFLEKVSEI
jgi:hypothetical protein